MFDFLKVDPFDGLPQLICKKCDTFLTDVEEKKKLYQKNNLKLNSVSKFSNLSTVYFYTRTKKVGCLKYKVSVASEFLK